MFKMPLDKPRPKTPKRVMEKKRRARINDSLTELKNLVLQALNRSNPRHSKLEKADILEMTVKYLRSVHGRHVAGKSAATPNPVVTSQYRSGFSECMLEVSKFLDNSEASSNIRLQLLDHLSRTCSTPHGVSSTVGTGVFFPGGSYNQATTEGSLSHSLPIFRLPTNLSQDSSHSAPQPANLASDSVQSLQAMQNNSPPTLPVMNIQLAALSKVPAPTLSMPIPSLSLSTPSMPFSSHLMPPPISSSILSPTKLKETDPPTPTYAEHNPAQVINSESIAQSSNSTANAISNSTGTSVVISRTQGGDVTVVLPHSALPGGKMPTHLIPIYQPSLNVPEITNVIAAVSHPDVFSPPGSQAASTSTPVSVPMSSASPLAGTIAPVTWCTRLAYLTANIDQGHAVLTQQGTPITITLPIQARIVQNVIPIQAAPIAPGRSFNHFPIRIANPNGDPLSEQDLMWRPW